MEYLLKSTFVLSLFYVVYKLFLQKETFFQSLRFYFLAGIITAIVIPFIIIKKYVIAQPFIIPKSNNFSTDQALIVQQSTFSWNQILIAIYILGVLIFLTKFLIQLTSLFWFLYKNPKYKKGNFTFVETQKEISPFSFFNFIVVNKKAFKEPELDQIITHEKTHATQFHSIDNLLIQFLTIFHWFNPLVWLYTKEIQKNLEFIADEFAQKISVNNQNYQHLLLKTISPDYQMALTTNFYNSLIKKRIDMLQKKRSNNTMQLKFALIIPVLIAFIFTFNTKVIAQKNDEWKVEIKTDRVDFYETITKNFTKTDLEKLKTRLASQDIIFKFKKLKFNSNNEITGISMSVKDKNGNESNLSQKGDKPIKTIYIHINSDGILSLGNTKNTPQAGTVFVSSGSHGEHVINSSENTIFISDKDGNITSNNQNGFAYSTDGNSENKNISVWVSDDGNGNKKQTYTIKKMESGDDMVVVDIDADTISANGKKFIIETDNAYEPKKGNIFVMSTDGKKPLIIIDGKEMKDGKIDDIDPDSIKSMNVLKGENATKKYGAKGKDGVIEITTKK